LYESFNGVVLAEKEGKDIAACLGGKKAALLQNHGLLTVGGSVEEVSLSTRASLVAGELVCWLWFQAVFWFLSMEKCCQSQLMAEAAAGSRGEKPIAIGADEAAYTYRTVGSNKAGWFSAKPLFDVIHKETGGDYLE
jgi:ribulose-5-phosphate 4-epimerase/fuculose-1-phosphate aldolase